MAVSNRRLSHRIIPIVLFLALCFSLGCSPVPRKYLREAAPNVTLAALAAALKVYLGRLIVMGAVILEELTKAEPCGCM
jgi:hypothetical protein